MQKPVRISEERGPATRWRLDAPLVTTAGWRQMPPEPLLCCAARPDAAPAPAPTGQLPPAVTSRSLEPSLPGKPATSSSSSHLATATATATETEPCPLPPNTRRPARGREVKRSPASACVTVTNRTTVLRATAGVASRPVRPYLCNILVQ